MSGSQRMTPSQAQVYRLLPRPLTVIILIGLICASIFPIIYMVLASFNSDLGVTAGEIWPSSWNPDNFVKVWTSIPLAQGLANSALISGATALVSAIFGLGLAYVLVRYRFRGRLALLRGFVALQSVPSTMVLLPLYVVFATLASALSVAIIGTRWAVFVTYLSFALPFATWVLVTNLRGLPIELDDAAKIDGAGPWTTLTRIITPLMLPAIVVSAIFSFLLGWNDVIFAKAITNAQSRTAALVLSDFAQGQEGGAIPQYAQIMVGALACALPVVLLYMAFQRFLVGGLTSGAVK